MAMKERKTPMAQMVTWLAQVFLGMEHLHMMSALHRDLKPQNVIICSPYQSAKLTDYGCSRIRKGSSALDYLSNSTSAQDLLAYIAPELWNQDEKNATDFKADVYAFGVIVWAVMTRGRA